MVKIITFLLLLLIPTVAFGAIAFDNAVDGGFTVAGTSLTYSFTATTTANRILIVSTVGTTGANDLISGITYNSVALTKVATIMPSGGRWLGTWYLLNPSSGANNVVVTASSTDVIVSQATSYAGVKQSANPDVSTTTSVGSGTSLTSTLTTLADNAWTVLVGSENDGQIAAGTGTTFRVSSNASFGTLDSNAPITPAGSTSLQATWSLSASGAGIMVSLAPVASTSTLVSPKMSVVWIQ